MKATAPELIPDFVIPPVVTGNLLFLGYRGSLAHGTHVPGSDPKGIDDKDLIGVFVAPESHYLGLSQVKETIEVVEGEWDVVYYELRHFVRLLLKSNPNVLSTLWLPDNKILGITASFRQLVDKRDAFVSKDCYPAFQGYAYAQLKKMTKIIEEEPARASEIAKLEEEISYREEWNPGQNMFLQEDYARDSLQSLRQKRNNLKSQKGYMGAKRKALTEEYGYDTKNAAHLVRLLRMGIEFLTYGKMYVDRTGIDAEELIAIKRGRYSLKEMEALADYLFEKAKFAVESSALPEKPDKELIEKVFTNVLKFALGLLP